MKRRIRTPEEQDAYTRWRKVLFWQQGELARVKRRTHKRERREGRQEIQEQVADPFANSPFNDDVIKPGDPGWAIFEEVLRTGRPVLGVYNSETGEIVSMDVLEEE